MSSRAKFGVLVVSSVVVLYAVVGGMLGRVAAQEGTYPQLAIFMDVIERIQEDYVDEPSLSRAMEGAIRGMVESVDPNGGYLSPESVRFYESFDPWSSPGIGVILVRKFDYPTIVVAIPDGPAAMAGLGTGDTIEGIDGESLREHNLVEVHQLLTGQVGTTVELNVIRRSSAATEKVSLTRALASPPPVEASMVGGNGSEPTIAHIRIPILAPGTGVQTREALERLTAEGATSVILDLRNSAGDSRADAIEIADVFIDSGTLGYVEGQTVERETFNANPDGMFADIPLAVLINEGTAEAAEILAGAIRDNDRGPVVGLRSFGSASVRRLIPLNEGWALLLAVADYYTPSGDDIQADGVRPTVEVAPVAAALDPLAVPGPDPDEEDADRQLDRAIELLLETSPGRVAA